MITDRKNTPPSLFKIFLEKPEQPRLVSSRLSSPLPVQPACRHLMTASLHLSQPSDLCVNRRHQQLALTQRASAHLQGKKRPLSTRAFNVWRWIRLMAELAYTVSAWQCLYSRQGTTWKDALLCNKDSSWTFSADSPRGWEFASSRYTRSKLLLTFLANTDLFNSSRIVAMFSQRPLISMCTFTDGGLLVISGLGGRLHGCPAQVQTHTEDVMTGSESLCGYSVEFKCQSPCPAPSPLPLSRSLFHLSSRPLSSLPSPPVFVRVGD